MKPSPRSIYFFLHSLAALNFLLLGAAAVQAAPSSAVVFSSRCSSCHSVGKGVVVGPDLKGVTARHDRPWLHRFIHSSQTVVKSGDPQAVALFQKYGRQVMPDHPLTDAEIDALLAFIEAGGPGGGDGDFRPASAATALEVAKGKDLFLGRSSLLHGGPACVHCHAAGKTAPLAAGDLAPNLAQSYRQLKDWRVERVLLRPQLQFPVMADLYGEHPVTPEEAYALAAFLDREARSPLAARTAHPEDTTPDPASSSRQAALLGFGGSALLFWWTERRRGRRKP
ncbi:MAG TPA: cytochrome c [Fimbriimonadaceae bacterium]|nr:cytochrome c [Fimbriimonadaceae bacterium]